MENIGVKIIDSEDELFSKKNESNTILNAKINENVPLNEKINAYIQLNNPTVYLLTPCFASLCYVNYVHCLMQTVELFRKFNIKLVVEFCRNDSLVTRARNNLIARAMNDPNMTHVIFIDNDISWDPVDILKLMVADKQLIGGIYPLKNYNWNELIKDKHNPYNTNVVQSMLAKKNQSQFKQVISDENMIQHNLLKYNVNYLTNTLNIDQNLTKLKHIATGFMMIQRNVIEKMFLAFPSTKYADDVNFLRPDENKYAYALFDCGVEDGHYYSEDWLFCHRWTKMGGTIWADVSINLTHTGIEDYRGCYLASLI
jgi:hypothetical protein